MEKLKGPGYDRYHNITVVEHIVDHAVKLGGAAGTACAAASGPMAPIAGPACTLGGVYVGTLTGWAAGANKASEKDDCMKCGHNRMYHRIIRKIKK